MNVHAILLHWENIPWQSVWLCWRNIYVRRDDWPKPQSDVRNVLFTSCALNSCCFQILLKHARLLNASRCSCKYGLTSYLMSFPRDYEHGALEIHWTVCFLKFCCIHFSTPLFILKYLVSAGVMFILKPCLIQCYSIYWPDIVYGSSGVWHSIELSCFSSITYKRPNMFFDPYTSISNTIMLSTSCPILFALNHPRSQKYAAKCKSFSSQYKRRQFLLAVSRCPYWDHGRLQPISQPTIKLWFTW